MTPLANDGWTGGSAYDLYMGRWSHLVANSFVDWLPDTPNGGAWADLGCGTGVLASALLDRRAPETLRGFDGSEAFVDHARKALARDGVSFDVADMRGLPMDDDTLDAAISGLVLNFLPRPSEGLAEMKRVTKPGGLVAFYVWDYPGGGMGMIDVFWSVAREIDPRAAEQDEAVRFPDCTADGLTSWATEAGLTDPRVEALEETSIFKDFDDFWTPFTTPTGPAPQFAASLDEDGRDALRRRLEDNLGPGPIELPCRAWALSAKV